MVPDKPPKPGEGVDLDTGWDAEDSGVSERPTVAPPFDLESYAKENAERASEVVLHAERSIEDRLDAIFDDSPLPERGESSRAPSDTAVTMPPPPLAPSDVSARLTPQAAPSPVVISQQGGSMAPSSEPMSRRETPKGMEQIEVARALSAREDAGAGTALSLVNMRVPSNVPPRAEPDDPVLTLVGEEDAGAALSPAEADLAAETDPVAEMHERFSLGDYSGALVMAESLLEENPTHVEAREYAESCRAVLQQMYTAKIGPLDRVPVVEVAREQLRWLSIDHRAGFVLSLVDGVSSLEMILDVSGMPTLDALRILYELVQQHIIAFKE